MQIGEEVYGLTHGAAEELIGGGQRVGDQVVTAHRLPPSKIRRIWSWPSIRMPFCDPQDFDDKIEEIRRFKITDVVLHLNTMSNARQGRTFQFARPDRSAAEAQEALHRTSELLKQAECDVHLMMFPAPNIRFMESAISETVPIVRVLEPRSLLLDAEDNWGRHGARRTHTAVVNLILQDLCPVLQEKGSALGFTDDRLIPAGAALATICDYVMPQAYSTLAEDGNREPGRMQRERHARFQRLSKPTVMALPAWSLRRPVHRSYLDAYETMAYTLEAVEELDAPPVTEVAYWNIPSATNLRRNRRGDPPNIVAFLQAVSLRARSEHRFQRNEPIQ